MTLLMNYEEHKPNKYDYKKTAIPLQTLMSDKNFINTFHG